MTLLAPSRSAARQAPKSSRVAIGALLLLSAMPLTFGVLRLLQFAGLSNLMPPVSSQLVLAAPLVTHIVGAAIYAILGAFQFSSSLRRRWPVWHRTAGKVALVAGALVALSALWLTFYYAATDAAGLLLVTLRVAFASLMLSSLALGFRAILQRNITRHREWMIRAYALGLGSATQMLVMMIFEIATGASPAGMARSLLMGLAWTINLAAAELIVRRKRAAAASSR